ncbi:hypothetical protein D3C80_1412830 [compost metagenome]
MGMHDAADVGKFAVQRQMGSGIRRGFLTALNALAISQIDHHHILHLHMRIFHAGRFDHHQPAFTVNGADVTPGKGHQLVAREVEVGLQYLLFKLWQS